MEDERSLRERLLGVSPAYQRFLDLAPSLQTEPVEGRTLLADGWKYKDIPPLTGKQFETFLEVVGRDNIVWLSLAVQKENGLLRCQMFISPAGQALLKSYLDPIS